MTDNVAVLRGYTREIKDVGTGKPYLVMPKTETNGRFTAWDMDDQCFCLLDGWGHTFEETPDEAG